MLKLTDIVKTYDMGHTAVEALRGVSIEFRRNEFVAILGPSGCGKTTMLNIIGGLDRYTGGDLTVNQVSTKAYRDSDWDAYRNRRVGFVFQSYNLIPHQTVLANVELAMTLSGVSAAERKRRATEVLERVGLGDQLRKKPNQLSGGQMQRVAIARALVNNPEILLADEPTGSLDSENSIQVGEILKEIAQDRLVILVTHNAELAAKYSTRIVRLLDGKITDDSNPYSSDQHEAQTAGAGTKRRKKPAMSLATALSLSLNNLMTKKGRTLLTSFAGSMGIIGIALILSLSSGMQAYIAGVQRDTMSSYPLTIESTTVDMSAMLSAAVRSRRQREHHELDRVYSHDVVSNMMDGMREQMSKNDLKAFKEFLEGERSRIGELANDIKYGYGTPMSVYQSDTSDGVFRVHPNSLFGGTAGRGAMQMSSGQNADLWTELLANEELVSLQYDVIAGRLPESPFELVLFVDKRNELTDYAMYSLGLKDPAELRAMMRSSTTQSEVAPTETVSFSYEEILDTTFKLVPDTEVYQKVGGIWVDRSEDPGFMEGVIENGVELTIVGILRPAEGASVSDMGGGSSAAIGYPPALSQYLRQSVNESPIVKEQMENPEIDVFTGLPFTIADLPSGIPGDIGAGFTPGEEVDLSSFVPITRATLEDNLRILGVSDPDSPKSISIYPKDFDSKTAIKDIIDDYNQEMTEGGQVEHVIQYTDFIDLMLSSVSTVINAISYILIAFVAISLVVSSIMIGIITYISVLERTREIGILRSIGASKGDISRVFNAETLIVGFVAGAIGIGATVILCIPANAIIERATGIPGVAALPVAGGFALLGISMVLTLIAGVIPSRIASKKDPVVALRTE